MLRLALRLTAEKPRYAIRDSVLRLLECTPDFAQRVRSFLGRLVERASPSSARTDSDEAARARALLSDGIACLDVNDHRLVALRYDRRLTFSALASETGLLSRRSARRRVKRAEESLRRILERRCGPGWAQALAPLGKQARGLALHAALWTFIIGLVILFARPG